MRKVLLCTTLLFTVLFFIQTVAAEDMLKPMIDSLFNAIKSLIDKILDFLYLLFPSLGNSIRNLFSYDILYPISEWFPFIRNFYFLFYLAAFFAIMLIIAKLWSLSKHYIINSIVGIILLMILIHFLGVEIQVTILKLIIIAIFGIPGLIFILILHYLGIPL